jgi:hypothetical protein
VFAGPNTIGADVDRAVGGLQAAKGRSSLVVYLLWDRGEHVGVESISWSMLNGLSKSALCR